MYCPAFILLFPIYVTLTPVGTPVAVIECAFPSYVNVASLKFKYDVLYVALLVEVGVVAVAVFFVVEVGVDTCV